MEASSQVYLFYNNNLKKKCVPISELTSGMKDSTLVKCSSLVIARAFRPIPATINPTSCGKMCHLHGICPLRVCVCVSRAKDIWECNRGCSVWGNELVAEWCSSIACGNFQAGDCLSFSPDLRKKKHPFYLKCPCRSCMKHWVLRLIENPLSLHHLHNYAP